MLIRFENKGGALYGEISPDEKSAKITSLEVKKSFQKSGFGTELFERFQKEALKFSVERIEIDAYKKSLDFWRKKGFDVCDKPQVIDGYAQDYHDGSKDLAFELVDLMSDEEREMAIEELVNRSEAVKMSGETLCC